MRKLRAVSHPPVAGNNCFPFSNDSQVGHIVDKHFFLAKICIAVHYRMSNLQTSLMLNALV